MTVYGYLRVSTDEQDRSGLGLDAQRRAIGAEADRRGWTIEWVADEGFSVRDLRRPGITDLLARLGDGDVLVTARLDRLSRSLVDFAGLMERAQRHGWSFVALDLGVDMTTPGGRLVANVMAAVAQWERGHQRADPERACRGEGPRGPARRAARQARGGRGPPSGGSAPTATRGRASRTRSRPMVSRPPAAAPAGLTPAPALSP